MFIIRLIYKREETNRVTNDTETSPMIPDNFKNNTLAISTDNTIDTVDPKYNLILNDIKSSTNSNIKREITTKHSSKDSPNVSLFMHYSIYLQCHYYYTIHILE